MNTTKKTLALCLGLMALGAGIVMSLACSDDDGDEGTATRPPPATTAPRTLDVKGIDYGFTGLPSEPVAVGSKIEFENSSNKELHELVALRINDNEKRAVKDLVQLPDEQLAGVIDMEPAMVIIAPPAQDGVVVVGDGTFTQAGRYAIVCFVPTGADPAAFLQRLQESADGPPAVDGGPPHAFQGMVGEITVK